MFGAFVSLVRDRQPLVHAITNYVTVNDCANCILAIGASPVMADEISEVEEILGNCLLINIGTINERTLESMIKAGKKANMENIPVVLDPVGVMASSFRKQAVKTLLEEVKFTAIAGNISEISFLAKGQSAGRGVDAGFMDTVSSEEAIAMAKQLSAKTGAIIVISGKTDIIANENDTYMVNNGSYYMGKITGSGCMQSAIIASFLGGVENTLLACVCGACAWGICGEIAEQKMEGTMSFRMHLIDALSNMSENTFNQMCKITKA